MKFSLKLRNSNHSIAAKTLLLGTSRVTGVDLSDVLLESVGLHIVKVWKYTEECVWGLNCRLEATQARLGHESRRIMTSS